MLSLSSAKPKSKSSVKAAIGAVRDFIGGHQEDEAAVEQENLATANAAQSLTNAQSADEAMKNETIDQADQTGTQPQLATDVVEATTDQKPRPSDTEETAPAFDFDQAVRDLRAGESAETRAAAARLLADAGSQRATPHLIAALFDGDATVRTTANEVLAQFGNSTPSNATSESLPNRAATAQPAAKKPRTQVESVRVGKTKAAERKPAKPIVTPTPPVRTEPAAARDPQQLLGEENEVRTKLSELEAQILDSVAARKEAEKEIRWRIEREAKLRTEAAARSGRRRAVAPAGL